ncbi:MAG: Nramp family divalent metal transporter [Thermoproteota archaeon]|nr:Nramp family divalent metal transporter [Candidatus Brockarchaeota archaeon]
MNFRKAIRAISVIGPAILVSVELFDPASIVTATAAGAAFGFNVLWAAFYSGLMLIVIQEISARLGVVTGKTLAENIHQKFGKLYSLILFLPSILLDFSTLTAEVMGLSLAISFVFDVPYYVSTIASIVLTVFILILGSYDIIEKIVMFLVTIVFFSYFYLLFKLDVPLLTLVENSILPYLNENAFYYAEAVLGASIMPTYVVLHSGLVYEKGWFHHHHKGIEDLTKKGEDYVTNERIDSVFSLFMGTLLNIAIIACAATTLSTGKNINEFLDIAFPFSNALGNIGLLLFVLAFISAGISATITVTLASVYNTLGFLGLEERMNNKKFKLMTILWPIIAGIASFLPNKVQIIVFSQYLNGVLLPLIVIPLLIITRDEKIMKRYKIGKLITFLALIIVTVTTLLFITPFLFH